VCIKPCAKLYRKPLRNHKKQSNHIVLFSSREFKIILYSSINWWTEECLGKKPDWYCKKIKISHEKIVIPLQITFNKSLRQCKYPSILKNAHVTAIFKKGDTSLPSNYRPICLR
jgi:hypothetical protein